jgi:RNA polymerase sigma-70 factor (ECF subfamily)
MGIKAVALADPEALPEGLGRAPKWAPAPSVPRMAQGNGQPVTPSHEPGCDRPGFESFFAAEYPRLLRALYLVCGTRHEAEELAQDAFVRAYERWSLVLRADNRAGYVYRIALNLHRSKLRRAARAARKVIEWPPEPDAVATLADRDAIGRALLALSKGQQEALVMVEWLGMTDDEAGVLLGISPITVRVRIHRARAILRPLLREGGDE